MLGPRKVCNKIFSNYQLGLFVVAALVGFRNQSKRKFTIVAIARHKNILQLCDKIGADQCIDIGDHNDLQNVFDIVFDTTGRKS